MALTYVTIATVKINTPATSIEFTNISSSYTDLILKYSLRTNDTLLSNYGFAKFNLNGTAHDSNWSRQQIDSNAGTVSGYYSTTNEGITYPVAGVSSSTFGNGEIYIANYASSKDKTIHNDYISPNNSAGGVLGLHTYVWSNTSAITSIAFVPYNYSTNTFNQHSFVALYGIKKA